MSSNETMIERARELRKNFTDAEDHLWQFLKNRNLNRYKFRRQHVLGFYVLDFVCEMKKIIIELDGGQHSENKMYDEERTKFLSEKGYKVLRFWNDSVFTETSSVLESILAALEAQ